MKTVEFSNVSSKPKKKKNGLDCHYYFIFPMI